LDRRLGKHQRWSGCCEEELLHLPETKSQFLNHPTPELTQFHEEKEFNQGSLTVKIIIFWDIIPCSFVDY
jgi:hypothetical protein